jgi:type VI secretion system secreted protein Hcp
MKNSRSVAAFFVAAALVFAPVARAAVDGYLKFDGVEGESTHQDHKGAIELDSFQFGSLRSAAERASQSAGAGAGKVTFNPFSITRKVDKASPSLFRACADGKHFPTATISMRKAGGTQQEFVVVKLKDVFISGYRTSGGGPSQTETFTVNAADATLESPVPPRAGVRLAPAAASSALVAHTPTPAPKTNPAAMPVR